MAPELTETLSALQDSTRSKSSRRLMPPPQSGDEDAGGHVRQNISEQLPPLHRGGDVKKTSSSAPDRE